MSARSHTYLAAQYRRIAARRGKRATMAVAHSILVIAYHLIQRQEPYRELEPTILTNNVRQRPPTTRQSSQANGLSSDASTRLLLQPPWLGVFQVIHLPMG